MSENPLPAAYPPSPVPSDERLWPGELPFTAFGQFGDDHLDLRVFDQDSYWVDRLGRPHDLKSGMTLEYVRNVIAFLYEHAEYYYVESARRAAVQSIGDQLLFGDVPGEALALSLGGPSWSELSVEQWLESTTLMRGLRRRAALGAS